MHAGCQDKKDVLVLGSGNKCDYQLVLPQRPGEALIRSAELIQEAFGANGMDIPVVKENEDDASKPGIYLGDTEFARSHGIKPDRFEGWSYLLRVAGKDLIIAGSDSPNRHGVVKGVCDFLREYAGTRFLYPGETGIEYLAMPEISVPASLDMAVTPMLDFNYSGDMYPEEWLYNIANNHFPATFKLGGRGHSWGEAVPCDQYCSTNPEYFALIGGERSTGEGKSQYCISNPAVMELITEYMVRLAGEGNDIVYLGQPDGFTPCQCEECFRLYGTGDDWDEKVWLFHRDICERFLTRISGTKVLMIGYQATTHPPKSFDRLPDNAVIELHHAHDEALEEWGGTNVEVPGGIILVPRLFGSHYHINYLPKRAPGWLEERVRKYHESGMNILGLRPFGAADTYGLEGVAYYVFGRMFDDPVNNRAVDLEEEFYTAAFGEAVEPMRRFYGILHACLKFPSNWYFPRSPGGFFMAIDRKPAGVDDQLDWVRVSTAKFGSRGMHTSVPDPSKALSLVYTTDMILGMEKELSAAEAMDAGEKVKRRLELVRMEFDYMKNILTVNCLYNVWKTLGDQGSLYRLLDGIDKLNAMFDRYYGQDGKMNPVTGWPEMRPFRNGGRSALGLKSDRHWGKRKEYAENPFAWDTDAIRKNPETIRK
jgi:hypothetical protein